jgi:hypothetical protein
MSPSINTIRKYLSAIFTVFCVIFITQQIFPENIPAKKDDSNNTVIKINASYGKEYLSYIERDSETETESFSTTVNQIIKYDVLLDLNYPVIGIKGVSPVSVDESTEEWDSLGFKNYQKNDLKHTWARNDFYIGYSFFHPPQNLFYTFYTGVRQSDIKLKRNNFVILGIPQTDAGSTERIISTGWLFGIRGNGYLKKSLGDYEYMDPKDEPPVKWGWGWGLEAIAPVTMKLTNSTIPGVTFNERGGYTFEFNSALSYYLVSRKISIDANGYIGNLYWKGSGWEDTTYGRTKWPKNNTSYFGLTIGLNLKF